MTTKIKTTNPYSGQSEMLTPEEHKLYVEVKQAEVNPLAGAAIFLPQFTACKLTGPPSLEGSRTISDYACKLTGPPSLKQKGILTYTLYALI